MSETTSKWSLKRLSFLIGIIGVLTLGVGIWMSSQADFADLAELLSVAGWVTLGIGVVAFVIAMRRELYGFSQTRQAKYGANSILLTLSFIGVMVLINYLVYRHDARWDLTANKAFSISEQSRKIVQNLNKEVKILAFYSMENGNRQPALDTIELYRQVNQDKIKVEVIDPVRQPVETGKYKVTSDGTLIFQSGEATKSIVTTQEQDITNAILNVTQDKKLKVYFLQGHDELDPDSMDPRNGMQQMKQMLEKENYAVADLFLFENKNTVPDDAALVIVAGPKKPLTQEERKALKSYIDRQGRLLLMLNPQVNSGLEGLVAPYGVTVGNNIIIDPVRQVGNDPSFPAIKDYKYHPITKDLRAVSAFPGVRSVQFKNPPQDILGAELATTSPQSWGETNLTNPSGVQKDSADLEGPLSVAVAVSISQAKDKKDPKAAKEDADKADPQARLVVVGNTLFASNGFSIMLGNMDFFMNSVAWLAEQENLISIRAKDPDQRKITLTKQQESWIFYVTVLILPFLFLVLGGFIWWRRR